jgi:hypothetical protein
MLAIERANVLEKKRIEIDNALAQLPGPESYA